jgi:hypothetical protein
MGKKTAPGSPVVVGAMIGLMIAAWLQYRTVLALRRLKQEDVGGAGK